MALYAFATVYGQLVIVSVLASLFSAVTAVFLDRAAQGA
jgi:hypothetical protein